MREYIVLFYAVNKELTGYQSGSHRGEQIRRLDPPTICTKDALDLEQRGLLAINRTNSRRYEIKITQLGLKIYARRPHGGPWTDTTFDRWFEAGES